MDRNPFSDLEAVAAMPGLEELADVFSDFLPDGRGSRAEWVSMLVFLAGRWAIGSANTCSSTFMATPVWDYLRESAARVGRELSVAPPTFDKLRHLREATGEGFADALAEAVAGVAVPLAQSMGLLDPAVSSPWHRPAPGRVIYGDGTVFTALSDVSVDHNGEVQGSRAVRSPRLAHRFEGKGGPREQTGLPIAMVGCHGRQRWQRVILGLQLFRDANEIGASLGLFDQIIAQAGGGVSHVVYDRLMSGSHIRRLMKTGVLPVVAMPEAAKNHAHVNLPVELQRAGYSSAGVREKRKGKGARRRSADKTAPKARLKIHQLQLVTHQVGSRACVHELWAMDGAVVAVIPGDQPSINATYVECVDLRWEHRIDGWHPIGRLRVPCSAGALDVEIDFAADRKGRNQRKEPFALADWVRPVNESTPYSDRVEGLRSDSESVFSWLKAMLPRERASSLNPNHFLLDLVGAVLLNNAVAWDVHVAQHTACAQHEHKLISRRRLRAVA